MAHTYILYLFNDITDLVAGDRDGGGITGRVLHVVSLIKNDHLVLNVNQHLKDYTMDNQITSSLPLTHCTI